jgi:hypothetical protein
MMRSGASGTVEHLYDGLTAGEADAVLAASIFHYGHDTIRQCKEYLARARRRRPALTAPSPRPRPIATLALAPAHPCVYRTESVATSTLSKEPP